MKSRTQQQLKVISWLFFFLFVSSGCDAVYRILQKEGAEEKDILGEMTPMERNENVAEVQALLKLYGYNIGNVDGVLGASTRKAIEKFQVDNNLAPHRFVDFATWEKLKVFEGYGLVINGEVDTATVQKALKRAGFSPGSIDGKGGRRTQESLRAFQKASDLRPDGRIGFKTLKALADFLPSPQEELPAVK